MSTCGDVIVVGSGPSGAHAAYGLIAAGRAVTMLDVGYEDTTYAALIPKESFSFIRRHDWSQHRYFLGDDFEGIPFGAVGTGAQLTPPRRFVYQRPEGFPPSVSTSFVALESFALGGLGRAWGAGAFPFLDQELIKCSLPPDELHRHYQLVAKRVGVSGSRDDLEPLNGVLEALLPPLEIDHNAELMLSRYHRRRDAFRRAGVSVGRTRLAVLTQPLNGREPHAYHDMDFWSNEGGSVYRPDWTIRELQRHRNFTYRPGYLVESFAERNPGGVSVRAKCLSTGLVETFEARRLILAAGAVGTTRIVLRSLQQYDVPVPLTCNAHTYVPCIHYPTLGRAPKERSHSLGQLTMVYDPTGDREHLVQAQLFSYRSLLLFRLLQESSLPSRESLRILRALSPSLVIFLIHHEDHQAPGKHCILRRTPDGSGDYLELSYEQSEEDRRVIEARERVLLRHIRRLGCLPLKTVRPGHGSSIHYASQLPISREDKPLTTELSGRLRGTQRVSIADGSSLPYVPAKGLTLTLMANADRVGTQVLKALAGEP